MSKMHILNVILNWGRKLANCMHLIWKLKKTIQSFDHFTSFNYKHNTYYVVRATYLVGTFITKILLFLTNNNNNKKLWCLCRFFNRSCTTFCFCSLCTLHLFEIPKNRSICMERESRLKWLCTTNPFPLKVSCETKLKWGHLYYVISFEYIKSMKSLFYGFEI